MELRSYLEKTFNDCGNPCFVVDYETEELLFINQAMEKKFQIFEDYRKKNVYQVLGDFLELKELCPKEETNVWEYKERKLHNKLSDQYFRANTILIEFRGRKLLATKCFMSAQEQNKQGSQLSFEAAMTRCIEILSVKDSMLSIQAFLELLCQFYSCETAYICEFDYSSMTLASKYFWSKTEGAVEVHLDKKDTVTMEQFVYWLKNNNNREIISLDSKLQYGSKTTESQILDKYSISNSTMNKLWNKDGTLLGVLGLSNLEKPVYDDKLLKAISYYVVEKFNKENMVKAMESLNEMDLLTGFYNRNRYIKCIEDLHQNPPNSLGVIFVNMNGLRKTNEYFGFDIGDIQIKNTSAILRSFFTEDIYRISGDEFVGFLSDWSKEAFEERVDQLYQELKKSSQESAFSIGHSWETGVYNVSELVKVADTVMVINKQAYYFNSLKDNEAIANTILQDLFRGIAEDEFMVYLQPQIDLNTKEVVGAEALIRRYDKKLLKMIFPDMFVPLYEKNSIIRHIDLFVVRRVCQLLVEWGHFNRQIPISVNLSRVTLLEHGIVNTITAILEEYSVPHDMIVIEVTERIGLIENDVASTLVDEFKERGFRLSLDDFGSAYSNIVTLSQISVDEVKIDKSLVDNVLENDKNRVILDSMIGMCNKFANTHTLAEGIETEEQAEFLRSINCNLGQGYLYSRPIPHEEFFQKYIKNDGQ